MQKWYIVTVIPGHENKVRKALEDAIVKKGMSEFITEVALPSEQTTSVKNGKERNLEKRIYPGYIFLKMALDDETQSFVKNVSGIKGFLPNNSKPAPLTDEEMHSMLKHVEDRQKGGGPNQLKMGDPVKITHGSFAGYVGTVAEIDNVKKSLKVTVNIFGRNQSVEILHGQVELHTESD
jgi:transcriptional antiterminator NusG